MTLPPSKLSAFWQRARGSAMWYGMLGTAVRAGAQFFLLPVVLTVLSPAELSIWWLFLSLGTLIILADFGFGQTFTRIYSYLWAGADDFDTEGLRPPPEKGEPNLPLLRQVHAAAARLYFWLALAAIVAIGLIGSLFVAPHILASERPWWNGTAWVMYLLAIAYNLATSHWSLGCQGVNRVREYQRANLWSSVIYLAVAAVLLWKKQGLMGLVVATIVRAMIARHGWRLAYLKSVPLTPEKPMVDPTVIKRIWPNARRFGITFIGTYLLTHGNIFIGIRFLETDLMASLGLAVNVGFFLVGLANLWLNVKWPEITILRTQGKNREMATLFARRLGLMMISYTFLAALVLVAGEVLLEWKGTQTRFLPMPIMIFYFGSLLFQSCYGAFGMFTCTANVMPFHRVSAITGIGAITLSLLLAPYYGVWGMLLAVPVAELCGNAWFYIRHGLRSQPLRLREFFAAMVGLR